MLTVDALAGRAALTPVTPTNVAVATAAASLLPRRLPGLMERLGQQAGRIVSACPMCRTPSFRVAVFSLCCRAKCTSSALPPVVDLLFD
jgi:hypothetical protein